MLLNKRTFLITGIFFSIVLLIHQNSINQYFYNSILNLLYEGSIPIIETDDIDINNFTILDTREKKEFLISHLPNSKWVGENLQNNFKLNDVSTLDTVVVYCSVGYRSEKIAKLLLDNGYKNVFNLKGGIIEWTNRGNLLICNGNETNKIHPYSKLWELWILKGEISYDFL